MFRVNDIMVKHPDIIFKNIVQMLVMFLGIDEVKTQTVRNIYGQILDRKNIHGLMLILQGKMTPIAKKEVKKFPFKVEIFQVSHCFKLPF